jgi:hypothetical protein
MESDYQKELFKKSALWVLFNDQGDRYYKQTFGKEKTGEEIINTVERSMKAFQDGKGRYLRIFDLFKGTGIKAELVENVECSNRKQLNNIAKTVINNNDCINTKKTIGEDKETITQMIKRHKTEREENKQELVKEMLKRHKLEKELINKEKQKIRKSKAYIDKIISQKKAYCEVNKLDYIPIHYEEYY